jgi:hypothetical protein
MFYYSYRPDIEKLNIIIDGMHYFVNKADTLGDSFDKLYSLCKEYHVNKNDTTRLMIHQLVTYGSEIKDINGFEFVNYKLRLDKTPVPVPKALVAKLMEVDNTEELESLRLFWENSLLNPIEKARNDFFTYTQTFMSPITRNGYVIMYKAVKRVSEQTSLLPESYIDEMIAKYNELAVLPTFANKSKEWIYENFIKQSGYMVVEDSDDSMWNILSDEELENLDEDEVTEIDDNATVYDLSNFTMDQVLPVKLNYSYTPKHNGNYGMEINLGEPVTTTIDNVDQNEKNECSFGLHVGSYEYVKHFANSRDVILMCLVNPKNVVAIPRYDTSKIRVCEYIPIAEIDREDDGSWRQLESDFSEETYLNYEKKELAKVYESMIDDEFYQKEKTLYSLPNEEYIRDILKKRLL